MRSLKKIIASECGRDVPDVEPRGQKITPADVVRLYNETLLMQQEVKRDLAGMAGMIAMYSDRVDELLRLLDQRINERIDREEGRYPRVIAEAIARTEVLIRETDKAIAAGVRIDRQDFHAIARAALDNG